MVSGEGIRTTDRLDLVAKFEMLVKLLMAGLT